MSLEGMDREIGELIYSLSSRIKRMQDERDVYKEALEQVRKRNKDAPIEELLDAALSKIRGRDLAERYQLGSEDGI